MLIVLMCHSGSLVLHTTPKKIFRRIMSVTVEAVGPETPEQLTSTVVRHHPFAGKLKAVVLIFLVQHNNF